VTVNVLPAIVSVPVRDEPVLPEIVNPTLPLPVPPAAVVIEIHVALLCAVHEQFDVVVTVVEL
jgi:hypothetical protein